MPWKETSPGCFERSLDPTEVFFAKLEALPTPPGRERLSLTAVAKFESDIPTPELVPALRHAWKTMRHDYPAIGAIQLESSKVYKVPDDAALEAWLDETVVVEPMDADPDTIIFNYASTKLCKLHYLPGSSQIMIHTSHWRTDGVGLCMFVNQFFKTLADPRDVTFGNEAERLAPSLEEVLGLPATTPDDQKLAKELWASFMGAGPFIGFAPNRAISGGTLRKSLELSPETTSAFVAKCKERQSSVTSAIHAAMALAIRNLGTKPEGAEKDKILHFPQINQRRWLTEAQSTVDNPTSVMVINKPLLMEVTNFDDLLKQYNAFYRKGHSVASGSDPFPAIAWTELQSSFMNPNAQAGETSIPRGASFLPIPSLNSLGIIDRYISAKHVKQRRIKVTGFWFATEIIGGNMVTYATTFQGKLRLLTYYNEAMHPGERIQNLQTELKDILLKELDIVEV